MAVCATQLLSVSAGATAYHSTEPRHMHVFVDTTQYGDNLSTSLIWSSLLPAFRHRLDPNMPDNILLYPAPSCSIKVMTSTPMPIPQRFQYDVPQYIVHTASYPASARPPLRSVTTTLFSVHTNPTTTRRSRQLSLRSRQITSCKGPR